MAINLIEGRLTFSFSDECKAVAYDKWAFVRNQYQSVCESTKAVDFLCIDRQAVIYEKQLGKRLQITGVTPNTK